MFDTIHRILHIIGELIQKFNLLSHITITIKNVSNPVWELLKTFNSHIVRIK